MKVVDCESLDLSGATPEACDLLERTGLAGRGPIAGDHFHAAAAT